MDPLVDLLELLPEDSLCFLDDQEPISGENLQRTKRRKRVQMKAMLDSLRDERNQLENELAKLQHESAIKIQGLSDDDAMWERVAMNQKALKLKAQRENDELRAWITEQTIYRDYLEKTLLKRPRLITNIMDKLGDDRWKSLVLGTSGDERIAAIHAIADRQYENVETEMITKGLFQPTCDVLNVRLASKVCTAEGVRYTVLKAKIDEVAQAAMEVLRNRQSILKREAMNRGAKASLDAKKQVFHIDDDTFYSREVVTHPNGNMKVTTSMITKKYLDILTGNVCIIWRSVLSDEGLPHDPDSFVNDEYGWLHFAPKDADHVHYKVYLNSSTPIPPTATAMDQLSDLVRMIDLSSAENNQLLGQNAFVDTVRNAFTRATTLFESELNAK
ncbi:hypothetical protein THRCLA_02029 [Thraustotheca clavata]|uniref:Uncharacterized protein n=1 Tax=Thraustotheca clavata TaxID=74557 RepID=A0A1W0A6I0_9STRA|nr:hypothetical protein THRCLA_02029 [Thraustotheca clavata]